MKSKELLDEAIKQFGEKGYEGTSLSSLSEEVGIKKQSVYAHFKSKEDLFLQSYSVALNEELHFVKLFLDESRGSDLEKSLHDFLNAYMSRYYDDFNMRFFFRTSFLPPKDFKDEVQEGTERFIVQLEELFLDFFEDEITSSKKEITAYAAMMSFLNLFDGLLVELLYGSKQRFQKRLSYSLLVFVNGINRKGVSGHE